MDIVTRAVHGSSVADVVWLDAAGSLQGCGAVALLWDKQPALAFTFDHEDRARSIAAAPQVALTFTDSRSTSQTFTPAALMGRPRLVEDMDGDIFTEHLLEQELRRYPPARIFADSFLLRREHWWYLPRLIIRLDVDAARPMPARSGSSEYLLAVRIDDRIETHLVTVPDGEVSDSLPLTPVEDRLLPSGPAILLGQDASFPDLAQWSSWVYRGMSSGSHLEVTEAPSNTGLGQVPSVWKRMLQQQAFGRACRKGIANAERRLA
ncbi:hypothetical protein [Arthrobacter sp. H14]|uniref:hypothetical protein n=1 Tax=Arthrobacter sp. H14 TaxID=1312959 RepID=UPI00047A23D6|nr:hypothetical protein [Arthrobacter sp. H14]